MCGKTCLGLTALTHPPIPKLTSIPFPSVQTHLNFSYHSPLKTQIPKVPKRFVVFANNGNGLEQDSNSKERVEERGKDEGTGSDGGGSDDDLGKNQRPLFGNIRWGDLLLDSDPNVLAVGLTGLLTWASVQVLSIALAILVAAGLLPPGTQFDLFRGTAAMKQDVDDLYPTTLSHTIKAGNLYVAL